MTRYNFVLRDDALDLELPITIYTNEPLDFEIAEDDEPSGAQLEILIGAACSGDVEIPEVTDAYQVLCEFFYDYMTYEMGEWSDEFAQRLGRLLSVASYFDSGVNLWLEHWSAIAHYAEKNLGYTREEQEAIAKSLREALQDKQLKLLKDIDDRIASTTKSVLNFNELQAIISINEHDLRRFLKAMFESGHYPKSWKYGRIYKIPNAERERIQSELTAWLVDNPNTK